VPHPHAAVGGRRRRGRRPVTGNRREVPVAGTPRQGGVVGAAVHRAELRGPPHAVHVRRRHWHEAHVRLYARQMRIRQSPKMSTSSAPTAKDIWEPGTARRDSRRASGRSKKLRGNAGAHPGGPVLHADHLMGWWQSQVVRLVHRNARTRRYILPRLWVQCQFVHPLNDL
jgi:hypothetical protein